MPEFLFDQIYLAISPFVFSWRSQTRLSLTHPQSAIPIAWRHVHERYYAGGAVYLGHGLV